MFRDPGIALIALFLRLARSGLPSWLSALQQQGEKEGSFHCQPICIYFRMTYNDSPLPWTK